MKKKTKTKVATLVKYSCAWVITIGGGFACYLFIYMFKVAGHYWTQEISFWFGFLGGILGTLCYFMVWSLLTPVVKWIWGKIRHSPKGFVKLVSGKAMTSRVKVSFKKPNKSR